MASASEIGAFFIDHLNKTPTNETPYPHWLVEQIAPSSTVSELLSLPFPEPRSLDESGTREVNNATRVYFDAVNQKQHQVCHAFSAAYQSPEVISAIEAKTGTSLNGSYLRIEYAQDIDGFWLVPHTDIGPKLYTMLIYLSEDEQHTTLGTDIYADKETHVGRSPFKSNSAMIFIPSDHTWHGFEPRKIEGVRKSIIVNYVTEDWRAREQLAFPDQPIVS